MEKTFYEVPLTTVVNIRSRRMMMASANATMNALQNSSIENGNYYYDGDAAIDW